MTTVERRRGGSVRGERRFAGVMLVLLLSGCSSSPALYPDAAASGHDFVLCETRRGEVRKISLWFEPGHVLEWELIRTDNEERNKIPLSFLDYGDVPAAMDQVFPQGRPESLREGQTVQVALEYSPEGELEPVIRNAVTRWYKKESGRWKEVSEMEESAPKSGRKKEQK
jgi:hypothetical protein